MISNYRCKLRDGKTQDETSIREIIVLQSTVQISNRRWGHKDLSGCLELLSTVRVLQQVSSFRYLVLFSCLRGE